ncbi:ThiF family adenylyltransferase [Luteimonas sp. TWI1416]|uniref:ThiF family adenylyltransferase n=1 Tax=unclassified Luteimonas TaxID=2629088 RepID=UPI00320BA691
MLISEHECAAGTVEGFMPNVRDLEAYVARNVDIISPAEQAALRASRILVAGCGSVGGSLVESFARLGGTAAVLADPEVFDDTNLNRQACVLTDIGRPKAQVLAERALAINPYFQTRVLIEGLTVGNIESAFEGVTCVFDAVDAGASPWVKYRLHEIASQRRIPVISGFDFGGKATLYVFDYRRRRAKPFYGRASAQAHREGRLAECVKWLGYRHFPSDFLGIIRDRMLTGQPWPQVTYCVLAMGALATRCILDLEMRRQVRHVVAFDVHDSTRTLPARIAQWVNFPLQLGRAFVASRRPKVESAAHMEPKASTEEDNTRRLVEAMILAPSPHNCQPWVFEVSEPDKLHLRWDPGRGTPVVDPDANAIAYSLGCAVEAAAQVAVVSWTSSDSQDFHDPAHIAGTLRIHGMDPRNYARGRGLLEARVTHRGRLLHVPLSAGLVASCAELASQRGAHALLREVDSVRIKRLAEKDAKALFSRLDYVTELLEHMRLDASEVAERPTGFTLQTLGLSKWEAWALRMLRRSPGLLSISMSLGLPAFMTRNAIRQMTGHGNYLLVAAGQWSANGRVDAGRALMRVWLELTAHGLHAQPVDFPISTQEGRAEVAELFGLEVNARPIALLRVGMASDRLPPRAGRLPATVFISRAPETATCAPCSTVAESLVA